MILDNLLDLRCLKYGDYPTKAGKILREKMTKVRETIRPKSEQEYDTFCEERLNEFRNQDAAHPDWNSKMRRRRLLSPAFADLADLIEI